MIHPQSIDIARDSVMVIDGVNVIDDSDQSELSGGSWSGSDITVDIELFNIRTGSSGGSIDSEILKYDSDSDFWYVEIDGSGTPTLLSIFEVAANDRTKFVAKVSEHSGGLANMRTFKFNEFAIENNSFENVWMRLPYQVVIGTPSKIIWYEDDTWANPLFEAEVYQNSIGKTSATDASRITHRGAIIAV